jgi:Homeodomain-like domain
VTTEPVKFVLEWERRWLEGEGRMNFSALCREFGVSRPQGYLWVARFRGCGYRVVGVVERSRRPKTVPTKTPLELEDFLVALRKAHPTWGPKKLHAWMLHHRPELPTPSPSTIGEVLNRRGMTTSRHRRARTTQTTSQPFADIAGPNATWCVDFKGHFRTGDGVRCMINRAHSLQSYPTTSLTLHVYLASFLSMDGTTILLGFLAESRWREDRSARPRRSSVHRSGTRRSRERVQC